MILSFDDIELPDKDWIEYRMLKADDSAKSINPKDLPEDFCPKACKLVDEFHRKTVNENVEWMLYFDYTTGDVVYCWKGEEDKSGGEYDKIHLKSRNIASLHNHPKKLYSFPSLDNFDILENDFEDYEIICANSTFWVIKCKGILDDDEVEKIRNNFHRKFNEVNNEIISNFDEKDVGRIIDEIFSDYLTNYLNNSFDNIIINKMEYS